jgi:hypothetical protein
MLDNFKPTLTAPNILRYQHAPMRSLYRSLCLLFLVGLLAGAASAADVPTTHAVSRGPGLSFSVADFDGDSKPDLASVQYGTSESSRTDYRIQLQLSAAGRQTFQIVAPIGGLEIISRDVNGDHALDLVLTTAWLRKPVAILLNDGHGNFSRVEPDAFPRAFSESETTWGSATEHAIDAVGVPPQSRDEIHSETELFLHLPARAGFAGSLDSRFAVGPFLISHLGRAPPFEIPHS